MTLRFCAGGEELISIGRTGGAVVRDNWSVGAAVYTAPKRCREQRCNRRTVGALSNGSATPSRTRIKPCRQVAGDQWIRGVFRNEARSADFTRMVRTLPSRNSL